MGKYIYKKKKIPLEIFINFRKYKIEKLSNAYPIYIYGSFDYVFLCLFLKTVFNIKNKNKKLFGSILFLKKILFYFVKTL